MLKQNLARKTSASSATVERKWRSKWSCTPLPSSPELKPTALVWDFSCKIKRKQQCHLLFALKNCQSRCSHVWTPPSLLLGNHLKNNHEITWGKHLRGIQKTTTSEAQESQERRRERAGAIQARLRLGQRQAPCCVA